jgi:hypothetical protein
MFAHLWAKFAAAPTRGASQTVNWLHAGGVVALCLLAAACVATRKPIAGADPSDPAARTPTTRYSSVVGGYVSRRPVEPAPWREQNERVTPPPKQ